MRIRNILPCLALIYAAGCNDAPKSPLLFTAERQYDPVLTSEHSLQEAAQGRGAKVMNAAKIARDNALAIHRALLTSISDARRISFPDGRSQATYLFPLSNEWYHVEARMSKKGEKALAIFTHRGMFRNRTFSYDGFPQALDGVLDKSTNDFFPGILLDTISPEIYSTDLQTLRDIIEHNYPLKEK